MKLKLQDIWDAQRIDPKTLKQVKIELTQRDNEHYEKVGWDKYREQDYIESHLPELGEPLCFKEGGEKVIEILGKRYRFSFEQLDPGGHDDEFEAKGKSITLEETDEPLSVPDATYDKDQRALVYYKFFGQPTWVQNSHYPADLLGNPCHQLLTIENGWGDCGNFNILIGFDKNKAPNVAYFEASCA